MINQTYTGTLPAVLSGPLPIQDSAREEQFTVTNAGTLMAYTTFTTVGFQPKITFGNSSGIAIASQWAKPPAGANTYPASRTHHSQRI